MNKNASYKISWMTFIANVFILLEHADLGLKDSNCCIGYVMSFFSDLAVPMMGWFFFITAFLFFRRINSLEKIGNNIKKRLFTLLVPYIIWNTIGMILHILSGDYTGGFSIWKLLRDSYLFYNGLGCGDGPLWYIARLFTYLLITPVIYYLIKYGKIYLFIFCEIVMIACNAIFHFGNYDFLFFLPIFWAGAYIGMIESEKFENFVGATRKNSLLVVCIVVFIIALTYFRGILHLSLVPGIYRLLAVILLVILLSYLGIVKAPITFVHSAGMYLYCAHDIVYRCVRVILLHFIAIDTTLFQVLLVFFSFSIMIGSWVVMQKRFPYILRILSGGRNERQIKTD